MSNAKIRILHNQVPHLIQDTKVGRDKITRKHNAHDSQKLSPFPAGDYKARQHKKTNMIWKINNERIDRGAVEISLTV